MPYPSDQYRGPWIGAQSAGKHGLFFGRPGQSIVKHHDEKPHARECTDVAGLQPSRMSSVQWTGQGAQQYSVTQVFLTLTLTLTLTSDI